MPRGRLCASTNTPIALRMTLSSKPPVAIPFSIPATPGLTVDLKHAEPAPAHEKHLKREYSAFINLYLIFGKGGRRFRERLHQKQRGDDYSVDRERVYSQPEPFR